MDKDSVIDELRAFVAARDWDQFHTPENLAKSISIEAAELLELFQWDSEVEKGRNRRFETNLVVAFTGASVGNGIRTQFLCDTSKVLGDDGARQGPRPEGNAFDREHSLSGLA